MGWLSDFMHWLLHSMIHMSPGWFGFCVVMTTGGLVALIWVLIGRHGNVTIGPDPAPRPLPDETTVVVAPLQYQHEWLPQEWLQSIEETTAAVIDLTDTVEIQAVVDPLADTVELEVADETTPLFYTIRRPKPYVEESFTQGIQRAQIERAMKAGAEQ